MSLNQPIASVKIGRTNRSPSIAQPRFIMFHGVDDPEMRLVFELSEGGRGWDYVLDVLVENFIPVRRGDDIVLVWVPGASATWRGEA